MLRGSGTSTGGDFYLVDDDAAEARQHPDVLANTGVVAGAERPRYFAGKLLTAEDLELEQAYHIERRRLLNRMFHGAGVVSGLTVGETSAGTVTVEPGFALDPRGREILVCDAHELTIPKTAEPVSICVLYREKETDRGTICETYEVVATTAVPEDAVVLAVM